MPLHYTELYNYCGTLLLSQSAALYAIAFSNVYITSSYHAVSMINSTISSATWVLQCLVHECIVINPTRQNQVQLCMYTIHYFTNNNMLSCDSTGHNACKHNTTLLSSTETLQQLMSQYSQTHHSEYFSKQVVLYNSLYVTFRFKGLEDPNDYSYDFNPCYKYSDVQCTNVYVSQ